MINSATVAGNMVRDAELVAGERPLLKGTVAVNHSYQKDGEWKESVSYIDFVKYNGNLESQVRQLRKGRYVVVEGRLNQLRWTTNEGKNRQKLEIVARAIGWDAAKAPQNYSKTQQESGDLYEEDLPF